jgi:hypothetical protein
MGVNGAAALVDATGSRIGGAAAPSGPVVNRAMRPTGGAR